MAKRIITLGRGNDNDIVLNEANVSTRHARIVIDGDEIVIEDLGSTNGTAIGRVENKVVRSAVTLNDTIYLGSTPISVSKVLQSGEIKQQRKQTLDESKGGWSVNSKSSLVLFTLGGCAILVLLITVGLIVTRMFLTDYVIYQGPESAQQTIVDQPSEVSSDDRETSGHISSGSSTLSKDDLVRRSVFLVICEDVEGKTPFRVGNAFAIDAGRVVTTGVVIQAVQEFQATGFPLAYLYSPAMRKKWPIAEMQMHPQYKLAGEEALTAQQTHDRLIDEIESNPPEASGELDQVKNQIVAARLQALEAMDQKTSFDIGLIRVEEPLGTWLESSSSNESFRPKQKLRVAGYAFDVEDRYLDREIGHELTSFDGRVNQVMNRPDTSAIRLVIGSEGQQQELAYHGCPVFNTQDQVIGLYSRPSPPREAGEVSDMSGTFDCVLFQHVRDFLVR